MALLGPSPVDEIKRITALKRSGRTPCSHVLDLVHLKLENIGRALTDLAEVRGQLHGPSRCCLSLHRTSQGRQGKEVNTVENFKVTLCPAGCGACPDVEMVGDEVRIGEAGNLAVLKRDEWNLLVDLIQSGQLTKV